MKTALLFGASGLVGSCLLSTLTPRNFKDLETA